MSSDQILLATFTVVAIIMSSTVHEWSHAMVATKLGDDTPTQQGRVTLDPLQHIELFGTIILPLIGSLLGGYLIGWARPVQFQPRNFRRDITMRKGVLLVAAAGPLSNIVLLIFCALLLKGLIVAVPMATIQATPLLMGAGSFLSFMIYINTVLAVFNLMPIPPLDGFHILSSVLKPNSKTVEFMQNYQLLFFFLAIFVIFRFAIGPALSAVFLLLNLLGIGGAFSTFFPSVG